MDSLSVSVGDQPAEITSHPVSREVKLQMGYLGPDSLYLVLEYPHRDVFDFWSGLIPDLYDRRLHVGIPADDYVIRKGSLGYKLSVWDGDARIYITDRVEAALADTSAAGQGMGVMLQLGPRWLVRFGDALSPERLRLNVFAQLALFGIRNADQYPARINRLDIALDVVGLALNTFSIDEWRRGWVGYASQKMFHDSSLTGQLEGFSIGSSSGAVRFKVYDKAAQSIKIHESRFWRSVWNVADDDPVDVARFEWSIKPFQGHFTNLRYLADFTFEGFLDLLNYASIKWGRLCVPSPDDSNQTRWPMAPLWLHIRQMIDEWSLNYDGIARRDYDLRPDLNDSYLKTVTGWVGGLMARLGIENKDDRPASIFDALTHLESSGFTILERAQQKWAVLSRLNGGDHG
ncbi:hypothetical protein QPK87_30025 [Kamptonema cortianum]|nr:hypothetical protein [Kamptonema cortianum]